MCNWLARKWHRRLRRIDRETIWEALRWKAAERYPEDEEQAALKALQGWLLFIQQPGQAHWRCDCAEAEELREAS